MAFNQQVCLDELLGIAGLGQQATVTIDGEGFSRHPGPANAKSGGIFRQRIGAQGEIADDIAIATYRGHRIHQDFLVDRGRRSRSGRDADID